MTLAAGKNSEPYGVAAIGRVVWSSEFGDRPNTLVRFDTQTETFRRGRSVRRWRDSQHDGHTRRQSRIGVQRRESGWTIVEVGSRSANQTSQIRLEEGASKAVRHFREGSETGGWRTTLDDFRDWLIRVATRSCAMHLSRGTVAERILPRWIVWAQHWMPDQPLSL